MHTGLVVQILVGPHPDFVFFLVTIWFLGLQKGRLRSPARLLKLSTVLWLMRLLKRFGCASCCQSCTVLLSKLPLFTVIIFQLSACNGIRFNTVAPSILRSTFILFERRWLSVKFAFSTCLLLLSSLISLLKAWRLLHFKTFVSASASPSLPLTLWGDVRIQLVKGLRLLLGL